MKCFRQLFFQPKYFVWVLLYSLIACKDGKFGQFSKGGKNKSNTTSEKNGLLAEVPLEVQFSIGANSATFVNIPTEFSGKFLGGVACWNASDVSFTNRTWNSFSINSELKNCGLEISSLKFFWQEKNYYLYSDIALKSNDVEGKLFYEFADGARLPSGFESSIVSLNDIQIENGKAILKLNMPFGPLAQQSANGIAELEDVPPNLEISGQIFASPNVFLDETASGFANGVLYSQVGCLVAGKTSQITSSINSVADSACASPLGLVEPQLNQSFSKMSGAIALLDESTWNNLSQSEIELLGLVFSPSLNITKHSFKLQVPLPEAQNAKVRVLIVKLSNTVDSGEVGTFKLFKLNIAN